MRDTRACEVGHGSHEPRVERGKARGAILLADEAAYRRAKAAPSHGKRVVGPREGWHAKAKGVGWGGERLPLARAQ